VSESDRRFAPTPARRERARKEGNVARSAELGSVAAFGAATLAAWVAVPAAAAAVVASFAAVGVVPDVLNLQNLAGYTTGASLHLTANNQIGFTTDPDECPPTRYA